MDSISNMIITMKNASMVSKDRVVVPFSALKYAIAQCLKEHGFVSDVSKKTEKNNIPVIEIGLLYKDGVAKIQDVARISKSSRRVYMGTRDLRPVKNGHGLIILSTPKGILSDKQAKKELVGGEALFKIW
ncbi:MAG TPA: 30S ribosomal protein S8 [Candidatus Paceibacterota bacterium]